MKHHVYFDVSATIAAFVTRCCCSEQ